MLARRFLDEFAERYGAAAYPLTDAMRRRLLAYRWPGNVRELRNAIESLVALSPPDGLDLELLPGDAPGAEPPKQASLQERLAAYERGLLAQALEATDGNRTEAAKSLGIGRATLYEKLDKHGLNRG